MADCVVPRDVYGGWRVIPRPSLQSTLLTFLFYRPDLDRLRCLLPFLKGGSISRRHTDSTDLNYVRVAMYHGDYTAHMMEPCVQSCWTMHGTFSNLAVYPPNRVLSSPRRPLEERN
jgi:hypothetical protein